MGCALGRPLRAERLRPGEDGLLEPVQSTQEFDGETLNAALVCVSDFIAARDQHLSVIALGGAVNTLYLKSRATNQDVDIFGSDVDEKALELLHEATEAALLRNPTLGAGWLSTETQTRMPGPLHLEMTRGGRKQNVKIFDGPGLTVYAAPWQYAFTAKVSRIRTGRGREADDLEDAITYLHEYVRAHKNRPVPVRNVMRWARHYGHEVSRNTLQRRINEEYRRAYGSDGIV